MMRDTATGGLPAAVSCPPNTRKASNVKSIIVSVAQLLADYTLQLQEDFCTENTSKDVVQPVKAEDGESAAVTDDILTSSSWNDGEGTQSGAVNRRGMNKTEPEKDEDAAPLTEEDVAEFQRRLRRLQRVKRTLDIFAGLNRSPNRALSSSLRRSSSVGDEEIEEHDEFCDYGRQVIQENCVLDETLRHFDRIISGFHDAAMPMPASPSEMMITKEVGTSASPAPAGSASTPRLSRIQPLLNTVSLSEGALSAFSRNVNVVFRRRPAPGTLRATPIGKRLREDVHSSGQLHNYWAQLASQQRRDRFALYTVRAALLPRVTAVTAPLYISPATRELARLNASAECSMLERLWCVHTKTFLLREMPSLARDVELNRAVLREALQRFPRQQQDDFLKDICFFRFLATDNGIVRVCVQHALFLDLTYHLQRRQWVLVASHWSLGTTSAGASLLSAELSAPANSAHEGGASSPLAPHYCTERLKSSVGHEWVPTYVSIQPQDREAVHAFMQQAFLQGGVSGGLQAANRLVCAMTMDTLALQLKHLEQNFFADRALGHFLDVEVRRGTFISFHLSLTHLFARHDACATGTPAPQDTVHAKAAVIGGTVVLERVLGTSISTRQISLPLGASSMVPLSATDTGDGDASLALPMVSIAIDMERFLWGCLAMNV